MALYKGSTGIAGVYKGSSAISAIYKGSSLIWESYRFAPENFIVLANIVSNGLNVRQICINPSKTLIFIADGNSFKVYNYSTKEYLGSYTTREYNNTSYNSFGIACDDNYIYISNGGTKITKYQYSFSNSTFTFSTIQTYTFSTNYLRDLYFVGNDLYVISPFGFYKIDFNNGTLEQIYATDATDVTKKGGCCGAAYDKYNDVFYVVDGGGNTGSYIPDNIYIVKIDKITKNVLKTIDVKDETNIDCSIRNPTSVIVDKNGLVYVGTCFANSSSSVSPNWRYGVDIYDSNLDIVLKTDTSTQPYFTDYKCCVWNFVYIEDENRFYYKTMAGTSSINYFPLYISA